MFDAHLLHLACAATVAAASAAFGTALVRQFARARGILSRPNRIAPQHTRPVAYLGGVGVAIGVGAGALCWNGPDAFAQSGGAAVSMRIVLIFGAAFLALGIMDDLREFGPAVKFAFQSVVAALAVSLGVQADFSGVPAVDWLLSWSWICTLVNAFNFVDVSDGLLASVSVCIFVGIAIAFPSCSLIAVVTAGSCIGFLPFNRPTASIFLGDAGSHLLGFLAAALTIGGAGRDLPIGASAFASTMLLTVPLFELVFITTVRFRKGIPWWKGSPDHFALRLQAAGASRGKVAAIACLACILAGATGLVAVHLSSLAMCVTGAATMLVGAACWRRLLMMIGEHQ